MQPLRKVFEYPSVEQCIGGVAEFDNTQPWIYHHDNPYLHDVYAPVSTEMDVGDLQVEGEVPADPCGAYFRNGPNPRFEPKSRYHPFDGDTMLRGVYFREGRARNRYVDTLACNSELRDGRSISPGVMGPFDYELSPFGIKDTYNTDVFFYDGSLMSLWYNAGHPYRVYAPDMGTRGYFALAGHDKRRMSAHFKVDPHAGELLFFDYGNEPPYMTYGVADARGRMLHEVAIELPGPRQPHNIGVSCNYTILHDLPIRFGVIPRHGAASKVRWFECEPGYILHTSNCWEEGDWLIMDGCRSINPMLDAQPGGGGLASMLAYRRLEANNYRRAFNLRTGEVREGSIDDLNTEFNKTNPLYMGIKGRYAYHQRIPLHHEGGYTLQFKGLVKYDNDSGRRWQWDYGPVVFGSEAVYAPRLGATALDPEDDGYVVNVVSDSRDWQSHCLVFDATDIESGPIARVHSPQRVGYPSVFMQPGRWVKIYISEVQYEIA